MERRSMVSDRVRVAEAVDTLHSMFGAWDIQVLEAVLESNRFDMDRAIDQLLTMEPPGGSGNATSTSRVILPDDFLRVPGYAEIKEQEKKDAMLAMMLQDELFRNELLASEEFSHVVTNEQGERQRSESTETDYMAVVGDKISSMSDSTYKVSSRKEKSTVTHRLCSNEKQIEQPVHTISKQKRADLLVRFAFYPTVQYFGF